jgi:hypothetical protein
MTDEVRARVDRLDLPWNTYPYGTSRKDLIWFFRTASRPSSRAWVS